MASKDFRWIGHLVDPANYGPDEVGEMFASLADAEIALYSWRKTGDWTEQSHNLPDGTVSRALMPGVTENAELWLYSLGHVMTRYALRNALEVPLLSVYVDNGPDRIVRIGPRGGTKAVRP